MKKIGFMLLLLSLPAAAMAQISGMWHSSAYDDDFGGYTIHMKGRVKSWTMTDYNGETRTMTFDKAGGLTTDTFKGTVQTFVQPHYLAIKLKKGYEMKYPNTIADSTTTYNERQQLVKRQRPNYFEQNTFDAQGRILVHRQAQTTTETTAWSSTGHASPTYTYELSAGLLVVYRYNDKGSITETEYFSTNPFENVRVVYLYDKNNNLTETNRYNNNNIGVAYMPDNYLSDIFKTTIDADFSIEKFYKNYWGGGKPLVEKWAYNTNNQKTEYTVFGHGNDLSFRAVWEYDTAGNVAKETQYDVYHDRVRCLIWFDKKGNVIKETRMGYDGAKDATAHMKITYY